MPKFKQADFISQILHLPLENCVIRRRECPLAYKEDHETYCMGVVYMPKVIDLTECPRKIQRRDHGSNENL